MIAIIANLPLASSAESFFLRAWSWKLGELRNIAFEGRLANVSEIHQHLSGAPKRSKRIWHKAENPPSMVNQHQAAKIQINEPGSRSYLWLPHASNGSFWGIARKWTVWIFVATYLGRLNDKWCPISRTYSRDRYIMIYLYTDTKHPFQGLNTLPKWPNCQSNSLSMNRNCYGAQSMG